MYMEQQMEQQKTTARPVSDAQAVVEAIAFDACICSGKGVRPRSNCWADVHNLKVAK